MTERNPGPRPDRGIRLASAISVTLVAGIATMAPAASAGAAPSPCPSPPQPTSEGSPSARFLSMLAVLRRPQTPDDTLPASMRSGPPPAMQREDVFVRFVRRARVVDGTAYYLVPVGRVRTLRGCTNTEEVVLVAVSSTGSSSGGGGGASEIAHGKDFGMSWRPGDAVVYGVVPDRVAKVTIRYRLGRHGRRTVSVTTRPVGNVFVASVPRAVAKSAFPVLPKTIVWRSARGTVIRTVHPGG